MNRHSLLAILLIAFLLFNGPLTMAQEEAVEVKSASGKVVKIVEVKQNETVSTQTILTKIRTAPGSKFSRDILNDDIKRLYGTGYFSDVSVDVQEHADGIRVVFIISEKPIVRQISFKGNRYIRNKRLQEVVKSQIGEFLDNRQLKDDTNEIYNLYEKKGFHLANIDSDVTVEPRTNKAHIIFLIEEGVKSKVKKILIIGNQSFKTKKLLKLMKTKKKTWFSSGFFKKEAFYEDIERLKAFYEHHGFIDVDISSSLRYAKDNRLIYIDIEIDEGTRYLIGDVGIQGNSVIETSDIVNKLSMKGDSIFSHASLEKDAQAIQDLYFEKGYIFASIRSDVVLNEETQKVDVTYNLVEGELCYVDKIIIKGNTKTKDVVVRRELRIFPGDRFDGVKLRRSKERLYNLGFFEEVSYDIEEGSGPTRKNLAVTVKEAKTGEFSFGGGYSSIDKLVGFVEIAQNNFDYKNYPSFTGAGQRLRVRAEFGRTRRDYLVSFTEPWIFDRPISFGFDAYRTTHYRSGTSGFSYDEQRTGGALRLGKAFGEFNSGKLTYRLEEVDISDVPTNASADFLAEEGENTISSLTCEISRDTRDSVFNPKKGYITFFSTEVAGGPFGADKDFMKHLVGGSVYFEQIEDLVLELRLRAGIVDGYSSTTKVPIYERFFAGGANTIRGYKERRVGPRDISGESIGGESFVVLNAEYVFPLFEAIKGAIFYDVGNVWDKVSDIGSGDYKSGTGVGVRIRTPIGPIKLDYGYPLDKLEGEEQDGRFYFSMSRGF